MLKRTPLAVLLMVLLALPLAAGCRKGNAIMTPQSTFSTGSISPSRAAVAKLIMQGCVDAGWTPIDMGNDVIEARIVVRNKHTVIVDIPYTLSDYKIVYKNSVNMEYGKDRNGMIVIHPNYNNWVIRLNESIRKLILKKSIG